MRLAHLAQIRDITREDGDEPGHFNCMSNLFAIIVYLKVGLSLRKSVIIFSQPDCSLSYFGILVIIVHRAKSVTRGSASLRRIAMTALRS